MLRSLLTLMSVTCFLLGAYPQTIIIDQSNGDFQQLPNGDVQLRMLISQENDARERYNISLSRSFDGGEYVPLDVSEQNVAPGQPITFRLNQSDLKGKGSQLRLRVEVEASVWPLEVEVIGKVKVGKELNARWKGYNVSGPYDVALIDNVTDYQYKIDRVNGSSAQIALEEEIDKGSYTLRVTPDNNREAYGETQVRVAGGSKALLIAAPIVVGGGAAAFFLLGGDPEPDPPVEGLPAPPNTPTSSN